MTQLVTENPFFRIGVLVDADERTIQRELALGKRFSEVGRIRESEFDYPFLPAPNRGSEAIQQASKAIEKDVGRVFHSLFWFWHSNHIDQAVHQKLRDGEVSQAIEVWGKVLSGDPGSMRYFSALGNLSTLHFALSENEDFAEHFLKGAQHLGTFLSHTGFPEYAASVCGHAPLFSKDEMEKRVISSVLDYVKPRLEKPGGIGYQDLISVFAHFSSDAAEYVASTMVAAPRAFILSAVSRSCSDRAANKGAGLKIGNKLLESVIPKLKELESLTGARNVEYQVTCDKLSEELLQCAIDGFNHHMEEDTLSKEIAEAAVELGESSLGIACGQALEDRIEENLETLQDWVDHEPERQRHATVKADIDAVIAEVQLERPNTVESARTILSFCHPRLIRIRDVVGVNDELYMALNRGVVGAAQSRLIDAVNHAQQLFSITGDLRAVKNSIVVATAVMHDMSKMDMPPDVRTKFNENKSTLDLIRNQIELAEKRSSNSAGCFIATAAYGDYDHPSVQVLRRFRDEKMLVSQLGEHLVALYYRFSPGLSRWLIKHPGLKQAVRKTLEKIVKRIE